jgi:hypothetical protein
MVLAEIDQFKLGATEGNGSFVVDYLIRNDDIRRVQRNNPRFGIFVRDEGRAQILERLTPAM